MKKVDEEYGPLDWRLPEAHAIYWAALGWRRRRKTRQSVKPIDLITLRRVIYQSMLQAFHHGRLVINPFDKRFDLWPEPGHDSQGQRFLLTNVCRGNRSPARRTDILQAHRNFLRDAVYFLYETTAWPRRPNGSIISVEKYPDKPIIDNHRIRFRAN